MRLIRRILNRRHNTGSDKRRPIIPTFFKMPKSFFTLFIIVFVFYLLYLVLNKNIGKPSKIEIVPQAAKKPTQQYKVIIQRVVRVYDGDTLTVDIKDWPPVIGTAMPIRINGVDTPEIDSKDPGIKKLAENAKRFVTQTLASSSVIELKNIKRDKYFRLDADVIVDGYNLGQLLINNKLAKPYDGGKKEAW